MIAIGQMFSKTIEAGISLRNSPLAMIAEYDASIRQFEEIGFTLAPAQCDCEIGLEMGSDLLVWLAEGFSTGMVTGDIFPAGGSCTPGFDPGDPLFTRAFFGLMTVIAPSSCVLSGAVGITAVLPCLAASEKASFAFCLTFFKESLL